jgi:hypothetical protein
MVAELQAAGATSLLAVVDGLNGRCIPAPRGGHWQAAQVARVMGRLGDFVDRAG